MLEVRRMLRKLELGSVYSTAECELELEGKALPMISTLASTCWEYVDD